MRKALTYTSFIAASLLMIFAFVTAKTYSQLGIAVIVYPLMTYFAFKLFIKKDHKVPAIAVQLPPVKQVKNQELEEVKVVTDNVGITDIDKRAFLKIVGAAGLSFFVFSLLGRRAESLLFNKALDSGITKPLGGPATGDAGPTGSLPTDGYKISEIDENDITYYGFTNNNGGWLIMKVDTDTSSFRYAKGDSNFPKNWANRQKLKYDYFYNLF